MLTWRPLIMATAVPLTKLLMNGAAGFWKICCWPPLNWLDGCVQFSFSRAITKTVLIECPLFECPSFAAAVVIAKAAVRQPKSIGYFIWSPGLSKERSTLRNCQIQHGNTLDRGTLGWLCNRN